MHDLPRPESRRTRRGARWRHRLVTATVAALAVTAGSLPATAAAHPPTRTPKVTTWRDIPPAPGRGASWLEQLNWWRSLGAATDGSAYPAVTNQPADNVGPQNHVDYLAHIHTLGSTYCGHDQDPNFPKQAGVNYTHNVLFCQVTKLTDAVDGWLNTPFHGPPLINAGVTRVGAGSSAAGSAAVTAATTPITKTYLWPADGGVLPRLEMEINESPEPRTTCPPSGKNPGQPFYAMYPTTRTLVAATVTVAATPIPTCVFVSPWLPPATAGTQAGSFTFLTRQPFNVGDVVTASITTTATNSTDQTTTTWTFRVATPPSSGNGDAEGFPGGASIIPRDTGTAGGLPITGRHVTFSVTGHLDQVVYDGDLPDTGPLMVPLPPGNYTACTTVRNALGWSGCSYDWADVTPRVLPDTTPNAGFMAVDPVRLLDTRTPGAAFGRLQPGTTSVLDLRDRMPNDATAVAVNLAAVGATADGWVRAYPCTGPIPDTSSLNPERGQVTVTGAIIPLGDGRICLQTWSSTDLVIDLDGWLTRSATAGLVLGDQRRLLDTRDPTAPVHRLAAGQEIELPVVPAGSSTVAVALNITAADPGADGYVTVWPCGTARPLVSNLNPRAGVTRPNLANVRVSATGTVCLYTLRDTDLVVDLLARYDTGAPARYAAITPVRAIDTRVTWFGYTADIHTPHVPLGDVMAVQATVTATATTAGGYLSAYACATGTWPGTANVTWAAGMTSGNAALMPVTAGYSCLRRLTSDGQVIVDVTGFWKVP